MNSSQNIPFYYLSRQDEAHLQLPVEMSDYVNVWLVKERYQVQRDVSIIEDSWSLSAVILYVGGVEKFDFPQRGTNTGSLSGLRRLKQLDVPQFLNCKG